MKVQVRLFAAARQRLARETIEVLLPPGATLAELRRAIDPGEIANRGKKIAVGEAPALASHDPHPLEKAGVISRE